MAGYYKGIPLGEYTVPPSINIAAPFPARLLLPDPEYSTFFSEYMIGGDIAAHLLVILSEGIYHEQVDGLAGELLNPVTANHIFDLEVKELRKKSLPIVIAGIRRGLYQLGRYSALNRACFNRIKWKALYQRLESLMHVISPNFRNQHLPWLRCSAEYPVEESRLAMLIGFGSAYKTRYLKTAKAARNHIDAARAHIVQRNHGRLSNLPFMTLEVYNYEEGARRGKFEYHPLVSIADGKQLRALEPKGMAGTYTRVIQVVLPNKNKGGFQWSRPLTGASDPALFHAASKLAEYSRFYFNKARDQVQDADRLEDSRVDQIALAEREVQKRKAHIARQLAKAEAARLRKK